MEMYGRRARIGLIVPPTNTVMESEFHRMKPEEVSIHVARSIRENPERSRPEDIIKMSERVAEAAQRVAQAEVGVTVWGCTSGSFLKGVGFDKALIQEIEAATGIMGLTTSTAVLEALNEFSLKKVAVATPYIEPINKRLQVFLEGNGIQITRLKGLQLDGPHKISRQPPSSSYNLAKEVNSSEADGIFISCTDFRTIDIIERLEEELNKPVVSSNQASMWAALNRVRIMDTIKGYGSLLARK